MDLAHQPAPDRDLEELSARPGGRRISTPARFPGICRLTFVVFPAIDVGYRYKKILASGVAGALNGRDYHVNDVRTGVGFSF